MAITFTRQQNIGSSIGVVTSEPTAVEYGVVFLGVTFNGIAPEGSMRPYYFPNVESKGAVAVFKGDVADKDNLVKNGTEPFWEYSFPQRYYEAIYRSEGLNPLDPMDFRKWQELCVQPVADTLHVKPEDLLSEIHPGLEGFDDVQPNVIKMTKGSINGVINFMKGKTLHKGSLIPTSSTNPKLRVIIDQSKRRRESLIAELGLKLPVDE